MAKTYNDIIHMRGSKPVYSIKEEKEKEWESFMSNEQFNAVLRIVLESVRGNDIGSHKSFWLKGTYGTGKSHAVSVISHLLCDPIDEITEWVNREYRTNENLRRSILEQNKRLLPVKIEGLMNMADVRDLALVLQTAVKNAIEEQHDIEFRVDTDFEALIAHIRKNDVIWDNLIERSDELRSVAGNREALINKLGSKDIGTFQKARDAQRLADFVILIGQGKIGEWLIQIQEELRKKTNYKGLLIIWDEFTNVMKEAIGISILKELQTVAEKFHDDANDSFLFLISHPSAYNNLNEETKQTDGRYHIMNYNMEIPSAVKIMSSKFEIINPELHKSMSNGFYEKNNQLLGLYTETKTDLQNPTRSDLQKLFPIHPATASLAARYANVGGSSSRSIFEFIGHENIEQFLKSEIAFKNHDTVTADYLWDFVLNVFQEDSNNYGAVTERFNTYRQRVKEQGETAYAIFKGVLLLNALNNISGTKGNDLVTATEENINNLFAGTRYEVDVNKTLDWFDEKSIIRRDPTGTFSILYSPLPSNEIEDMKGSLKNEEYCFISKILSFGDTALSEPNPKAESFFKKNFLPNIIRQCTYHFYSKVINDARLKDAIKKSRRDARASNLYLALLFSKNGSEIAHLKKLANESQREDKDFQDIIFIVFNTPFEDKRYDRFIEYMANYKVAQKHDLANQVNAHRTNAIKTVEEWFNDVRLGTAVIYVNGETPRHISVTRLSEELNNEISPMIFPKGPDAVPLLRKNSPLTFWQQVTPRKIILKFISSSTIPDIIDKINGQMKPVRFLIQDVLDQNLNWRDNISLDHPFKSVFDFIQDKINNADKSQPFNFADKFDELRRPPYGLDSNYASAAMIAFGMRPWVHKIFDRLGKQLKEVDLAEIITKLFGFWNNGKDRNALSVNFQSHEEAQLCSELTRIFRLDELIDYNDISSLIDARYAITSGFIVKKDYPLWALKYMDENFCNSHPAVTINKDICKFFDNVVKICESDFRDGQSDARESIVKETLNLVNGHHSEISNILEKPGSFENGFNNFLLSQNGINLRDSEIDSARNYIKENLHATIGYWKESEVLGALTKWRIFENAKKQREIEEQRNKEENERAKHAAELQNIKNDALKYKELKGNYSSLAEKKSIARKIINSSSEKILHDILEELINLDYEFIVDKIIEGKPES